MDADLIDQLSPLAVDVKTWSPDRYLATLFAPPERRASLFGLYAFDHEIARAQTVVREPMAGLVRLQWWDDVIDGFKNGKTVAHPIVMALQRAVSEGGLDPVYLKRAIDGRRWPFEEDWSVDREFYKQYFFSIGGSIACAAAKLLGVDSPEVLAVAKRAGAVSAAWGEIVRSSRGAESAIACLNNESEQISRWACREFAAARRQDVTIGRAELSAFFPGTLAEIRLREPARYAQRSFFPTAVPRLVWCWLRSRF